MKTFVVSIPLDIAPEYFVWCDGKAVHRQWNCPNEAFTIAHRDPKRRGQTGHAVEFSNITDAVMFKMMFSDYAFDVLTDEELVEYSEAETARMNELFGRSFQLNPIQRFIRDIRHAADLLWLNLRQHGLRRY